MKLPKLQKLTMPGVGIEPTTTPLGEEKKNWLKEMVMGVPGKRTAKRKTEMVVDGQHQARLDRRGIIGQSGTRLGCLKAISPKHRSHIFVGKDEEECLAQGWVFTGIVAKKPSCCCKTGKKVQFCLFTT